MKKYKNKYSVIIIMLFLFLSSMVHGQSVPSTFGYPTIPDQSSTGSYAVGSINGNFSVNELGAACYSMDIEVPKGISCLQPNLGIVYNSLTGNGVLGDCFSLRGLSVITRGPKDISHDHKAGGVAHTMTDNFFLDGQRLVLTEHAAGSDSAKYCLELDPFTNIILHGLNGTQLNTWFCVQLPNGRMCRYGLGSSKQSYSASGEQKVNAWYLYSMEDAMGNNMTYEYTADSLCLYLSTISYGNCSVQFTYENRPDILGGAMEDVRTYMRKRLSSIKSYNASELFREYLITYPDGDYATLHHSRIGSVTVKGQTTDSSDILPPTEFTWNYLPAYSSIQSNPAFDNSIYYHGAPRENIYFCSADLNGDGLTDIAELINGNYGYGGNPNRILIHYSSVEPNGNVHFQGGDVIGLGDQVSIVGMWKSEQLIPLAIDIDGDGMNELLAPEFFATVDSKYFGFRAYKGGTYLGGVKWPTISTSESNNILCCAADFNNDGICEIAALDKTRHTHGVYTGVLMGGYSQANAYYKDFYLNLAGTPQRMLAADLNTDGLCDIVVICDGGYTVFWNGNTWLDDHSTPIHTYQSTKTDVALPFSPQDISAGDFNGDGIIDFLMRAKDTGNLYFALGNGDGRAAIKEAFVLWTDNDAFSSSPYTCNVFDMDGDGLSDAVITCASNATVYTWWLRSNGNSFEMQQLSSINGQSDIDAESQYYVTGDFNGDGLSELGALTNDCYNGSTMPNVAFRLYQNQDYTISTGKVGTITDGYGNHTQISYKSLADTNTYQKEHDAVFPMADLAPAMACVASVTEGNGAAPDIQTTYVYKGLKGHLQGRGLLGMSEISVTNNLTGLKETTTITERDVNTLLPEIVMKRQTLGNKAQWQESTYHIDSILHRNAYNYYKEYIVSTDYDRHQDEVSYTLDPNTGALAMYFHDSHNDALEYEVYEEFTHVGGRYLPQRVTRVAMNYDFNEIDSIETQYAYNGKGLLIRRTDYANTSQPVATTYTYDSYGNVVRENTSAADVENITNTYEYTEDHRFVSKSTERDYIVKEYAYRWDYPQAITDKTRSLRPLYYETTHNIWGQPVAERSPEGRETVYTRGWGANQEKRFFVLRQGDAQPWVKTWYDSRGREVLMESIGASDMPIAKATHYDLLGRVSSIVSTTGNTVQTESFSYDDRDRILSRTFSDNQGTAPRQTTYTYGQRYRTVTSTTAGVSTTKKYDAYGRVVAVDSPAGTLSYTYYPNGKPAYAVFQADTVVMRYDGHGNRTHIIDPDAGTIVTTYDAYDRVKTRTNSLGTTANYTYDGKGRIRQVDQEGVVTTYEYGLLPTNKGRLMRLISGDDIIKYVYDYYGRVVSELRDTPLGRRTISFTYDSIGQHLTTTYPGEVSTQYLYDCYGYPKETLLNNTTPIWKLDSQNGNSVLSSWNGGMKWLQQFNSHRQTTKLQMLRGGQPLNAMTFNYDAQTGNLIGRTIGTDCAEAFAYDNMDRLATASTGSDCMVVEYLPNGNIASKTGIGQYHYDRQRPHAVTSVDNDYGLISTDRLDTHFNAFGKVDSICHHGDNRSLLLHYGPDGERWMTRFYHNDTLMRTNLFMGDYEETVYNSPSSFTQQFYYLDGNTLLIKRSDGTDELLHMLTDHQGSVVAIVDTLGNYRYQASYDPWGHQTVTRNDIGFFRGYTGHEMLPEFGLINMNGRMYDPLLARFLSPDDYVQLPEDAQSFNRYSYCLNNPLKYTDPSGEIFGIDDAAVAAIIVGAIVGGVVNLGIHASNGQIRNFWDGFAAIAIGAGAGTVGAWIGGAVFAAAGGAAAGAGGAIAGSAGGMAGVAISIPIESISNNIVFGDEIMPWYEYLGHVALAGVVGGVTNGALAKQNGKNFWNGKLNFYPGFGTPAQSLNTEHANIASNKNPDNQKTLQKHHFATNKNKAFTPKMKQITDKYNLNLKDDWNIETLPHIGRHPNEYHNWVLRNMQIIDNIPNMDQQRFLIEFNLRIKQPVINNPSMLQKKYYLTK